MIWLSGFSVRTITSSSIPDGLSQFSVFFKYLPSVFSQFLPISSRGVQKKKYEPQEPKGLTKKVTMQGSLIILSAYFLSVQKLAPKNVWGTKELTAQQTF